MKRTLGLNLFATALVAAVALAVIIGLGALVDNRVTTQIETIRTKHIPKIGLANQLETAFERVSRQLRDAADGLDPELIDEAARAKTRVLEQLAAARDVMDKAQAESARAAVETYYQRAESVTRRMIKGETGDALTRDSQAMQKEQAHAADLLKHAAELDEAELATAFSGVVDAQRNGARDRLVVSLIGLVLVIALSVWFSRRLYRGLEHLAEGFDRFGAGDFETPIQVSSNDELGGVARNANQMAERLKKLAHDRDQTAWLKTGHAGLADQLRGELDPEQVARRTIEYLGRYLAAPLGVLYAADSEGVLRPLAGYGVSIADAPGFAPGIGIVGEAAKRTEVTVLEAPKGRLPIKSAIADGEPTSLVLVPLVIADRVIGVIELAALKWGPRETELVTDLRETVAIAIDVARGRVATRNLLAETQHQAAELLRARRGIEQKADELARASAFKSQFLANMSHELRTPLNAIIGFSELMVDGAVPLDSEQSKEFLTDILTSGRHLLQLINDVLDLSKVEAGRLEFVPASTRLSAVVREVLAILRTTIVKKRIQIETLLDETIDDVTLDPARLKQVLYNYISNALKFTPDGGRVVVRAKPADEPGKFRIEVEDTGPGISSTDLVRLFVEFQQTEEGVKSGVGTGLGLALTRRLVEAQGGSVGVASVVGKGSVFFAVLPRVATATAAQAIKMVKDTDGGKPTILVVEDDPADREQLSAALERAGYAVEAVSTGQDAIARANARGYDAITLDLLLPDMTGLEVLQELRSGRNSKAPVVLITIVAEKGAVAGFAVHDILPKPLDERALVASLTRAGVKAGPADHSILVVDDDAASLKVISKMLGQLGYAAVCEQSSRAGLARAMASRPSAIVLDLIMPELSGFEFLDQLREDPRSRGVPVIVWTSKDLSLDERAELRRSADAIVAKGRDGNERVLNELAMLVPAKAGVA